MSAAAVLQMVLAQANQAPVGTIKKPVNESRIGPARLISGDLPFYRKYTEALLRRYVKMSMEAGRSPSLLGQEMFRAKVTHYKVRSFEDVVIFVCDVERCLKMLEPLQQQLIERIAMQEYTQGEAAAKLGLPVWTAIRRYNESLDKLTSIFLERGLLVPMLGCQE